MRNVLRGTAVALFGLGTIGLVAQDRTTNPQSSAITVVGCLQQGEQTGSLAGTGLGTSVPPQAADAAANLNEPAGFLLTDATPIGAAGRPAGSPTGTAGRPDSKRGRDDATTYALEGDANELVDHRGHRMEVTGTLAPPISSGAGTGRPNDPAFQAGMQRLRVASIKMIAATCKK